MKYEDGYRKGGYMQKKTADTYQKETVSEIKKYPFAKWPERGISDETFKHFGVRMAMSKDGMEAIAYYFPYYNQDGELCGYKKRDMTKDKHEDGHFTTIGYVGVGCKLFGQQQVKSKKGKVIVAEGECFPGHVEVFTEEGWKRFDSLSGDEKILQLDENLEGSFVEPLGYVEKMYTGDILSISNTHRFSSITTPNHNMVVLDRSGNIRKLKACDLGAPYRIPRAVVVNGAGTGLSEDMISLQLAVSADSKIDIRKSGKKYIHFEFKKERKIERLRGILERLNIKYTSYIGAGGFTSFNIFAPDFIKDKKLPESWLTCASLHERKFIIEEMVHWDGNYVPNREQYEFSSKHYEEAKWMQTIAHTCGYTSTIIRRENSLGVWYKVSILLKKSITSCQSVKKEYSRYDDMVYCVTVPYGRILVRCEDCIHVSGNCDQLSIFDAIVRYTRDEDAKNGTNWSKKLPIVVGLSCGAGNAKAAIASNTHFFQQYDEIIVAMDNDSANIVEAQKGIRKGKEAAEDIVAVLMSTGIDIKAMPYDDRYKDPNDYMKAGEYESLARACIFGGRPFIAEKVMGASNFSLEEVIAEREKGVYVECFPKVMDMMYGLRKRELTIVTSMSGVGKSFLVTEFAYSLAMANHKIGCIYLEEESKETIQRMMARHVHVNYNKFKFACQSLVPPEDLKRAYEWVTGSDIGSDRFYILDHFGSLRVADLMNKIRYLVYVCGCEYVILDHLSAVLSGLDNKDERKEFDMLMTELAAFVSQTDVGIIAVSHLNNKAADEIKGISDLSEPKWICVTKEHLRGSGSLVQFAWTILGLDFEITPERKRGRVRLSVLKNRPLGTIGHGDIFIADEDTGLVMNAEYSG